MKTNNPEQFDYYIPVRKSEIVSAILKDEALSSNERKPMAELIRWLALLFHVEFFSSSEYIKELYVELNPDRPGSDPLMSSHHDREKFLAELDKILIAANFRPLSEEEIDESDGMEGRIRVNIKIPTDVFSETRFYARGRRMQEFSVPIWFGLKHKVVEFETFDHVVFCMIPSLTAPVKKLKQGKLRAGAAYLKLFRDIPVADIKSLYPNAQAALGILRKLMITVPAAVAIIPLLMKIIPSFTVLLLVTSAYLGISGTVQDDTLKKGLAAAAVLAAVIGLGMRQWSSYDRYSLRHQKHVTDHAQFNKMNKNAGCFDYLIAASEDAEVKEAFLAYALLHFEGKPLSQPELDDKVEKWFKNRFNVEIDFEIDDAIAKLERLSMVKHVGGKYVPVPIDVAIISCTDNWRLLSSDIARGGLDDEFD
ncbi:MAG: DUF3754 domain-containing protein [Rhodobacteraceae bacterium]|nr:DUF3754 domain-containing protein [Paracoccaceae bacterium]